MSHRMDFEMEKNMNCKMDNSLNTKLSTRMNRKMSRMSTRMNNKMNTRMSNRSNRITDYRFVILILSLFMILGHLPLGQTKQEGDEKKKGKLTFIYSCYNYACYDHMLLFTANSRV